MNVHPDDRRNGLPPPRFGLGELLGGIALLSLLFASVRYVGAYGALIAVFFLLCALAHVAGNVLGSRLREIGSGPPLDEPSQSPRRQPAGVSWQDVGPPSRLRERRSLGKPIVVLTVVGALASGTIGGFALTWLTDGAASSSGIALGAGACSVLGAIWTFAAGSFVQVAVGAWYHAARDPRRG